MLLRSTLVIQIWRLRGMIPKEERHLGLGITVIWQKIKQLLNTGHVECGVRKASQM